MKNRLFLLILLLSLLPNYSISQEVPGVFEQAKKKAYSQDYENAIILLKNLIESYPKNLDYQIFLARVHNWNKSYAKAVAILDPLIARADSNEALEVMIQTRLWAGQYEEVIRYANQAYSKNPSSSYLISKVKALIALDKMEESRKIISQILEKEPTHEEALVLQTQIFKRNEREVIFSYLNTSFSNPGFQPWHLASVGAKTTLGSVPLLARVNYGNISAREGVQIEADAYPKLGKKGYLYANAGISLKESVFPDFRGAIEYFHTLNSSINLSLGGKYLKFDDTEVIIYTGQTAYTFSSGSRITYRPYLADINNTWTLSHALSMRFAETVRENYLEINLQYGTVPYEFFTSGTFTNLRTIRAGARYQVRLSEKILLQPAFMYEYEEYLPDQYRNRFNNQLFVTYRF